MPIDDLLAVVPPPSQPLEAGDASRILEVRAKVGLDLPPDYLEIARYYGSGFFVDAERLSIRVLNPFSSRYTSILADELEILKELKEMGDDEVPFPIHPAVPGLLPWGTDVNGGSLYWLTQGKPSEWSIFANPIRDEYFEEHKMDTTSFLAKAFTRQITCVMWQDNPEDPEEGMFFVGTNPVFFAPSLKANYGIP
jgi:hypothetical protein